VLRAVPHPNTASAAAVANISWPGCATARQPAIRAVTEQPAAVTFVSSATPLSTANTSVPFVT
jgi:hypothetical protein